MPKKVPVVRFTTPLAAAELEGLSLQATVALADAATAMRAGLLAFATSAGLVVMQQLLTKSFTAIVGLKHAKLGDDRVGNWHGTTTGQVVLGARKVTVTPLPTIRSVRCPRSNPRSSTSALQASLTRRPFNPNSTARAAWVGEVRSAVYKKAASSPRSIPRWMVGWTRARRTYWAGLAPIRPSMWAKR